MHDEKRGVCTPRALRGAFHRWSPMAVSVSVLVVAACAAPPTGPAGTSTAAQPTPTASTDGVRTLAKVDGWREGLVTPPGVFSALEIADDAETAQRMWDDNVPVDLPSREGDPLEPGRYGDLSDVDFTEQAVALWSGGQSGSCPGWASDVHLADPAHLVVTEVLDSGTSNACTADRNVYRTLVVVDRADLPGAAALPSVRATTDDDEDEVLLSAYPPQ